MSQANVERLRAAYESFNHSKQLDLALLTADVEFTTGAYGEVLYRSRDGVAQGIRVITDVFDELRAEPEEFCLAGAQIVVLVRLSGRAKIGGVPVEGRFARVFRFRGDRVDRWGTYADGHEALQAVGLAE